MDDASTSIGNKRQRIDEPQQKDLKDIVERYGNAQLELWQVIQNMFQRLVVMEEFMNKFKS